jgi:hypothetical protein
VFPDSSADGNSSRGGVQRRQSREDEADDKELASSVEHMHLTTTSEDNSVDSKATDSEVDVTKDTATSAAAAAVESSSQNNVKSSTDLSTQKVADSKESTTDLPPQSEQVSTTKD